MTGRLDAEGTRLVDLLCRVGARSDVMVTLADARRPDQPLVYVNAAFCEATGYRAGEVIGRNCRFLQGEATDPADVAVLRDAIASGQAVEIDLVNYRRDGSPFRNRLRLAPVRDGDGAIAYILGSQTVLSAASAAADRAP